MENKQNVFEKIEQYLNGTLEGDSLRSFEEQLKTDPELKAELELHRLMSIAVTDEHKDKTIAVKLNEIGKDYLERRNSQQKSQRKTIFMQPGKWAIAASFAILVALAAWFFMNDNTGLTNDELFAQTFVIPPITDRERSTTNDINTILESAYENYEKGNFNAAVKDFEVALTEAEKASFAYYQAIAFLASTPPDTEQAATNLIFIITDGDNTYVTAAKWYLALIHVKEGNIDSAKEYLQTLSSKPSKYQRKAKALLKDI
ncbi:MAG: hypothetical protein AAF502_24255 [Bacteroidota bacterium]